MSIQEDVEVLHRAGIEDVDSLIHQAAEFIRAHPIHRLNASPIALSQHEQDLLRAGGAHWSVDGQDGESPSVNLLSVASQYAQSINRALTAKDVAKKLGVTEGRVRQRSDSTAPTLYAINTASGRVYPAWQFSEAQTIPMLGRLLEILSPDAHLVAIERFMLTPHPDLVSDQVGEALSPRDWLISGHSPEPVLRMVFEI